MVVASHPSLLRKAAHGIGDVMDRSLLWSHYSYMNLCKLLGLSVPQFSHL